MADLRRLGHSVDLLARFSGGNNVHGILLDLETGTMRAGGDPRNTGYAIGF